MNLRLSKGTLAATGVVVALVVGGGASIAAASSSAPAGDASDSQQSDGEQADGADGTVIEVTVDAGNGAVLAQHVQDATDGKD
jgi:hypothetical protein